MTKKASPGIEAMFSEVESILKALESGELSLEDSLKRYEEAQNLLIQCAQVLKEVEDKVAVFDEKMNALTILSEDQLRN